MSKPHYIAPELRERIHKIFLDPPEFLSFTTNHWAISVRRTIYRERARITREEPGSILATNASNLVFNISDNKILITKRDSKTSLLSSLSSALK